MMSESAQGKVVEAEKFVLRDSQRTVRAELGINGINSTFIALYDDDGKKRARLVVPADGSPILELCDKNEKAQAEMMLIDAIGSASLTLGSEGAPRMILSAVNIRKRAGQSSVSSTEKGEPVPS